MSVSIFQKILTCFILLVFCVACAGTGDTYEPIVDFKLHKYNKSRYNQALADCRELAAQKKYMNGDTKANALGMGAVGAAAGAMMNGGKGALVGAAFGAGLGAMGGAGEVSQEKKYIIVRCLRNRGYEIIE